MRILLNINTPIESRIRDAKIALYRANAKGQAEAGEILWRFISKSCRGGSRNLSKVSPNKPGPLNIASVNSSLSTTSVPSTSSSAFELSNFEASNLHNTAINSECFPSVLTD